VPTDDAPPSSSNFAGPDSYRVEATTLVEGTERHSLPLVAGTSKDRAVLTILTGPHRGTVHRMPGPEVTIGRSDAAMIPIPDPGLSRIHARIYRHDGRFFIEDMASTNGTFIGDTRVMAACPLEPGGRVRLGRRTVLSLSLLDALEEQAALSMHLAALHDRLTGAYNRGVFDDRLAAEIAFAKRHALPLSVVLLDVDHFKAFNDTYGHQAGDAVLMEMGAAIQRTVRTEDLFARYGGEEFAILARSTPADKARVLGERVRAAVARVCITWQSASLRVTTSVGVATMRAESLTSEGLVQAADRALYAAKDRGRDCVVHADELTS
jgi:two-component system, cell cycle response regulator